MLLHPTGVGDDRGHTHPDDVEGERSRRPKDCREAFTNRRCCHKHEVRQPPGFRAFPVNGESIEKLLEQQRLVVADIVDAEEMIPFDSDGDTVEEIGQRQQVNLSRFAPNCHETIFHEPMRRFDELNASSIDYPGAEHHGSHGSIGACAQQIFLGFEPGARMNRLGRGFHYAMGR
jgi:hypothetical protein